MKRMLMALITCYYHKYQLLIFIMEGQELYFVLLAVASQAVRSKQRLVLPDQSSNILFYNLPPKICISFVAKGFIYSDIHLTPFVGGIYIR